MECSPGECFRGVREVERQLKGMLICAIDDLKMACQNADFCLAFIILDREHFVEDGFQATDFGT